jgi:DNA processing protein
MENSLWYQIALTLIPQLGPARANKLLERFKLNEIFKQSRSDLEDVKGIYPALANAIVRFKEWKQVEEEIRFVERNKIKTFFIGSANYPQRLMHCTDPPLLLYGKGEAQLNADKMIAVVGTRKNSLYGRSCTELLIQELGAHGVTIVSGLAYGIDTLAHQYALREKLPTIGVLAHGLDRIYPASNQQLARQILEKNGALLTENRRGIQADKFLFPRRNRIVAGMTDATLVIESDYKGGSLITASLAAGYNRDVFALPGRITDKASRGCLELIKDQRAIMITSAKDLLFQLGWDEPKAASPKLGLETKMETLKELPEDEQMLYRIFIQKERLDIDEILLETGWTVTRISSTLLNMELAGLIVSLRANSFAVV